MSDPLNCRHGHLINNCPICEEVGATGRFPQGKIRPDDEGELGVAIGDKDGYVVLDFGPTPVSWLSIDPDGAMAFAYALIERAMKIKCAGALAMGEAFGETKQ